MSTLVNPEAKYPYIELSQKLSDFWMALSQEQRKKIGAQVTFIIWFQGNSFWLMQTIRNTVVSLVPRAEGDFDQIMWIYSSCAPEIQQAVESQLTEYFTSRNQ
jgi:hypothetical protein